MIKHNIEKAYLVTSKTHLKNILDNKNITRLYIGDQECDFNLLSLLKERVFYYSLLSGKNITIMLPKFSGNNFNIFLSYLKDNIILINKIEKLEFCINDYAIVDKIKNVLPFVSFVNGAYINHQKRDAQIPFEGNNVLLEDKFIKGDIEEYDKYMNKRNIKSLDLFNVKHGIKINKLIKKINLFYPNIVVGFSRYCYSYNLLKGNDKLIIPKECDGCKGKNINFKGVIMGQLHNYKGNSYSYSCFTLKNLKDKELKVDRIIYNYDII